MFPPILKVKLRKRLILQKVTGFMRRLITNTREKMATQRSEIYEEFGSLDEKIKSKYGSEEVTNSILYILKLYDKDELLGF